MMVSLSISSGSGGTRPRPPPGSRSGPGPGAPHGRGSMGPAPRSAAAAGTDPGRRRKRTRRAGGRRPLRKGNPRSPARAPGGAGLPAGGGVKARRGGAAPGPRRLSLGRARRGAGPASNGRDRLAGEGRGLCRVGGACAGGRAKGGAGQKARSTAVGVVWVGGGAHGEGGAGGAPGRGCREGRAVPAYPTALAPLLPRARRPANTCPSRWSFAALLHRDPQRCFGTENGLLASTKGWGTVTALSSPRKTAFSFLSPCSLSLCKAGHELKFQKNSEILLL